LTAQTDTEANLLEFIRGWVRDVDIETVINLFAQALKLESRPHNSDPHTVAVWVAGSRENRLDTAGRLTMLMSSPEVNTLNRLTVATFIQDHPKVFHGQAFVSVHHCARMTFDLAVLGFMYAVDTNYPESVFDNRRYARFIRVVFWVYLVLQHTDVAGKAYSEQAAGLLAVRTRSV
jgi:hypothetical protein